MRANEMGKGKGTACGSVKCGGMGRKGWGGGHTPNRTQPRASSTFPTSPGTQSLTCLDK